MTGSPRVYILADACPDCGGTEYICADCGVDAIWAELGELSAIVTTLTGSAYSLGDSDLVTIELSRQKYIDMIYYLRHLVARAQSLAEEEPCESDRE